MRAIGLVIAPWNMGYTLLDSLVCLVVVAVPGGTFSCPPVAVCVDGGRDLNYSNFEK